jgi:FtsZ-binding cell division protein ZapB
MSTTDDVRKALQDVLAPEMTSIKEILDGADRVAGARWEASQSQYNTLLTSLELTRAQMENNRQQAQNNHDALKREIQNNHNELMNRLDALMGRAEAL